MRSFLFPTPRARFARLRWTPVLALASWLLVAVAGALVSLAFVAQRFYDSLELHDAALGAIVEKRALRTEIIRPARELLEHAIAGSDPERIDWNQLGRDGVMVAVIDARSLRVLARPAVLESGNIGEVDLIQRAAKAQDPISRHDQYCLGFPKADEARVARYLSLPRGSRVLAAACFDTAAVERAANVTLRAGVELTYFEGGLGILRVSKADSGDVAVERSPGNLNSSVEWDEGRTLDLSTPSGVLDLLVHGGSGTEGLLRIEEDRSGGRQAVYYLGGRSGTEGWGGLSYSVREEPKERSKVWPWLPVAFLALLAAMVAAMSFWSWSIAGRLTRRFRSLPAGTPR